MINLEKAYTCLSCNDLYKAIGGKQGVIYIDKHDNHHNLSLKESQKLSLDSLSNLSVASGQIIEIYDLNTGQLKSTLQNHKYIQDLSWSKSNLLASCSKDSKLIIWDIRTSSPAVSFNSTKGVGIYSLAWSKQSNDLLVSSHESALKLWDSRFSKKSLTTVRSAHPGRIINLDWSSNTNSIVSTSLLNSVKIWKTSNSSLSLANSMQTHFQSIKTLFSPDSSRVVYTTEQNEGKIQIVNTEDLKSLSSHCFPNYVEDIAWQGTALTVLCADRTLRTFSLEKGESKELNGEICDDEFIDGETMTCDINVLNFDEEIKVMEQKSHEGVNIEDYGLCQRYCLIRIHNKREFIKFSFSFPLDYPESPPNYSIKGCSNNLALNGVENVKSMETDLIKRSKVWCRNKGYSIQKACDFLFDQLNQMTETDGYEDFNDLIEMLEFRSTTNTSQIGCIHAWHPNGDLVAFTCSENHGDYADTEDLYDFQSSHYQSGIHVEKFGAGSDQEVNENQRAMMKVVHSKDIRIELFKELSFSGSLEDLCQKNSQVCEKFNLPDIRKLWSTFLPSLSLISSPDLWEEHPLGLKFIFKLLRYFWKQKNYYGLVFTSIFCGLCFESLEKPLNSSSFVEYGRVLSKDLMFLILKELSECLHCWGITLNSRAVMKIAGNMGNHSLLLSSAESLNLTTVHNYTVHSKNFCSNCHKKNPICAICLNSVASLGLFCKACGHGGHLSHMQKWFLRDSSCPTGCGCSCLNRMMATSEVFTRGMTR